VALVVPARAGSPPPEPARAAGDADANAIAIVAVPDKDAAVPGRKRVFYRVVPGDTHEAIAKFFRAAEDDLCRWNAVDSCAKLVPGMVLQAWVEEGFDGGAVVLDPARVRVVTIGSEEFLNLVEGRRGRKRLTYVARAGDTLKRIGARFGLTEGDLERINRVSHTSELRPGQLLVVYVPMTAAERREWNARGLGGGGVLPDDGVSPPAEPLAEARPLPTLAEAEADDEPSPSGEVATAAPADDDSDTEAPEGTATEPVKPVAPPEDVKGRAAPRAEQARPPLARPEDEVGRHARAHGAPVHDKSMHAREESNEGCAPCAKNAHRARGSHGCLPCARRPAARGKSVKGRR
jgi:membrane-bound lytic murein transglycosylase D